MDILCTFWSTSRLTFLSQIFVPKKATYPSREFKMVRPKGKPEVRYLCIIKGCFNSQAHRDEIKRHVLSVHEHFNFNLHWEDAVVIKIDPDQTQAELELLDLPARIDHDNCKGLACAMDSAGRGQREKKPSEKVKELTGKKPDTSAEDPDRKYPPVYAADHVVVSADVKEVEKFYQQTKVTATGEKYDFYTLGNQ